MLGKRILVVDDEDHICRVVSLKLQHAGFRVRVARDVPEARAQCLHERPDLIITDHHLPGPSGLDFCAEVAEWPGGAVPVILLTARTYDVQHDPRRPPNLRRIVAKPFSPRALVQNIRELLEVAA
ncbi:MAG: response regulator [Tepidisphaerales bacterium]